MSKTAIPGTQDLEAQALLYVAGLLDADQSRQFEQQLGEDQAARKALGEVVGLLQRVTAPGQPLLPSGRYRQEVRRRLGRWQPLAWLFGRHSYRGHPLLWTGIGVAAAFALMTFLTPPVKLPHAPSTPPVASAPVAPPAIAPEARQAQVWAEMPRGEHLIKVHDEEQRRRTRAEVLSRLARLEEIRLSSPGGGIMKN